MPPVKPDIHGDELDILIRYLWSRVAAAERLSDEALVRVALPQSTAKRLCETLQWLWDETS